VKANIVVNLIIFIQAVNMASMNNDGMQQPNSQQRQERKGIRVTLDKGTAEYYFFTT